jgi:hypothetical protein
MSLQYLDQTGEIVAHVSNFDQIQQVGLIDQKKLGEGNVFPTPVNRSELDLSGYFCRFQALV